VTLTWSCRRLIWGWVWRRIVRRWRRRNVGSTGRRRRRRSSARLYRGRRAPRFGLRRRTQHPRCRLFALEMLRHSALTTEFLIGLDISPAARTPARHRFLSLLSSVPESRSSWRTHVPALLLPDGANTRVSRRSRVFPWIGPNTINASASPYAGPRQQCQSRNSLRQVDRNARASSGRRRPY